MIQDQMEPVWMIETNDGTGYPFWRRLESGRKGCRVKFKCEVEVLEFWPSEHERRMKQEEDGRWSDGEEGCDDGTLWVSPFGQRYTTQCRSDEEEDTSAMMRILCLMIIVATVFYKWWTLVTS